MLYDSINTNRQILETENRLVVSQGWGEEGMKKWGMIAWDYFQVDENGPELDSGDG